MADVNRQLLTLFGEALECGSPEEQAAFLDRSCRDDPEVRGRLEALLRAHQDAGKFLVRRSPEARPVATAAESPPVEQPGTSIGPYKLLEQIGEGGFGVVFMAEQTQPVRRKVALKVLKPGMDTRQVVARFEAERQALALMDHPNIAKVFDGGMAAPEAHGLQPVGLGRPYFVMELVKGVPISEFCDQNHLTPPQRLELFLPVCQAVQHAHQKGIIHRDLKPSNVLVSRHDATPVVKVIDFGVAKALGQELTDKTLFTAFAQMIGTPLYMSPEQAGMSDLDIDTRSDIYSLGVLLYELLTGTTPFDKERFKKAGYDEMRRIIREEVPPKPSTRMSTMGQTATTASTNRNSDPKRLRQLFRGELDWIVMKALEKDRNRRYETASAFAADVQRYLNDEPVLACPPSASYRLRKFLRRYKGRVLAASVIVFLLAALAGGIGWVARDSAVRRVEAERVVTSGLEESASWQEQRRLPEALSAARRADGLLAGADVDESLRARVRARLADLELLDRLENIRLEKKIAIKDGFFDYQETDGLYLQTFRDVGLGVEALPANEAGQRIAASTVAAELAAVLDYWAFVRRENRGEDDSSWKDLLRIARLADPDVWRTRVREALERRDGQALLSLASSEEVFDLAPATLFVLGNALRTEKESRSQAEVFLRKAQRRHPNDFWLNGNLTEFFYAMQPPQAEEALPFAAAAVALRPDSSGAHTNLGVVLKDKGQFDEAIAEHREAIRLQKDFAQAHTNLGNALHEKGLLDEAIAEHREALRLKKDDAVTHNNLGTCLRDKGQLNEAIAEYHKALGINKDLFQVHNNLGVALHGKGLLDKSIAAYHDALRLKKDYAEAHNNLGIALAVKGQLDDAIAEWHKALRIKKDYAKAHFNLGKALAMKGSPDEASAEFREAIRIKKDDAEAHLQLGIVQMDKGQLDEAIPEFRETIRIKNDFAEAHCNLGNTLRLQGEFRKALEAMRCGHELGTRNPGWNFPSDQWVRQCERLVELDEKLPGFASGKTTLASSAERIELADLCTRKRMNRAAARFYEEAFTAEPKLAEDLQADHRYNAACAAALAGCGEGKDAAKPDDKERVCLRRQALDWLQADLDAWGRLLNKETDKARPVVVQQMRHWLADADFSGVRGYQALSQLPKAERKLWHKLWDDVAALLKRAQEKAVPEKNKHGFSRP